MYVGNLHRSSNLTLERISLECDAFTDDGHNLLNGQILITFNTFWRFNEEPHLPILLLNITVDVKRLVMLTTDEAAFQGC